MSPKLSALFLLLLASPALAGDGWDGTSDPAPAVGEKLHAEKKIEPPVQMDIRGHCTVRPGPGNPISEPCANLQLVLVDDKGKEMARTRTDVDGAFSFDAPGRGLFRIQSGSSYFEVANPGDHDKNGDVNLELARKAKK